MEEALGCIFSSYDIRDYKLKDCVSVLPDEYECNMIIPVKNQGSVSSCVAHACSSILEYHTNPHRQLSTNFIYGLQKELFNREGKGMILRDACKIIANYGSPEVHRCLGNTEVPDCYEIASSALKDIDTAKNAYEYHALKYFRCESVDDIKNAVLNYGPVLVAYKWYKDYKVKDGVLTGSQENYSGGHALVIYGWNKTGFLIQNSWGSLWGNKGKCLIPYDIEFREAYGIVDDTNVGNLKEPIRNSFMDFIYRLINKLINYLLKLNNKDDTSTT